MTSIITLMETNRNKSWICQHINSLLLTSENRISIALYFGTNRPGPVPGRGPGLGIQKQQTNRPIWLRREWKQQWFQYGCWGVVERNLVDISCPSKIFSLGQKIKLPKTWILQTHSSCSMRKTAPKKQLIFERWGHSENGQTWPQSKSYSPCKILSLGQKIKLP